MKVAFWLLVAPSLFVALVFCFTQGHHPAPRSAPQQTACAQAAQVEKVLGGNPVAPLCGEMTP